MQASVVSREIKKPTPYKQLSSAAPKHEGFKAVMGKQEIFQSTLFF
jgi:hypothetical protein